MRLSSSAIGVLLLLGASLGGLSRRLRSNQPASAEMVPIPAATFRQGCDSTQDPGCSPTEQPAHPVQVGSFRIDRTEVSQGEYLKCVHAQACTRPVSLFEPERHPLRPVIQVSWDQARTFCAWQGNRLPTEAEWELAARGTDGRIYPWGDDPPTCGRAHTHDCGPELADVGQSIAGKSPFGVLDMAGNVDEWVEDWYVAYAGGPEASQPRLQRVARGGAWDAWHARSSARNALQPDYHDGLLGFRCAHDD